MGRKMIDPYLIYLIKKEPFYASISRYVNKRETKSIPTAAVGFDKSGNIQLSYNPEFIRELDFEEVIGVLKHEFLHIVFLHLTDKRLAGFKNEDQHKFFNIAADLAINSYLDDELPAKTGEGNPLPFAGTTKGSERFSDWPKKKSAEHYLDRIRKMDEDEQEGMDGEALDIHQWYDDMSEAERAIAEEKMEEAMAEGAEEAVRDSWGSVPQEIREEIQAALSGGEVNWKKVLRQFVTSVTTDDRFSSVRRKNRKYGDIHPGQRRERRPKVAVSVDMSGSISDVDLEAAATELNKLAELVEFTVIPFDTDYSEEDIFEWDKGEKLTEIERVRRGGTDLTPATRYVNDNDFQGHIMFTDMEAEKPIQSQCKRMYLVPENGNPMFETRERVIRVTPEHE